MMRRKYFLSLAVLMTVIIGAQPSLLISARAHHAAKAATFKVRIENISSPDGQTAADGTRWPFALSPGVFVISKSANAIFVAGEKDRGKGLEAQAEDGNPAVLAQSLKGQGGVLSSDIFNTPVGASAPAPAGPGGAFEFTFSAAPGSKLSFVLMFGQSNDLFYAPEKSIALFDSKGQPISGDITAQVSLWDAGTEVNEEPGVGADQAPRQKAPNTGQSESKAIGPVADQFTYPKTNEVLRVTITPENQQH